MGFPSIGKSTIAVDNSSLGCKWARIEIAVEYDSAGVPRKERHTYHVNDDHQRVALLETEHDPSDPAPTTSLVRYQSPDRLDSAQLETDGAGNVISYEVFHPFGTTAYQATAKTLGPAAKRFRYTGMERDEETGLGYHGARYYIPRIGRWTAPDLHPDTLDGNRYAYVNNNPMAYRDPNGRFEEPVHGALTYRLALAAGFSAKDAATIAIATAGMDHEAATRPGDSPGEMMLQIFRGTTQTFTTRARGCPTTRARRHRRGGHRSPRVRAAPAQPRRCRLQGRTGPAQPVAGPPARADRAAAGRGRRRARRTAAIEASAAFAAGGAWGVLGAIAVAAAVTLFAFCHGQG